MKEDVGVMMLTVLNEVQAAARAYLMENDHSDRREKFYMCEIFLWKIDIK